MNNILLRISVLVFALLQPFSGYLSGLAQASILMQRTTSPLITPASYAFSIWAVITLGCVGYALYQLLPGRKNAPLYAGIAPYVIATFIGFSAWLYAAEREWLYATVAIFFLMAACLYVILRRITQAAKAGKLSALEQVIVHGTFGLYAGWATIAVLANIASVVAFKGILPVDASLWQLTLLLAAVGICVAGVYRMRGSLPYAAALVWAFVAIVVGTLEKGAPATLTLVAGIGALAIAYAFWSARRR